ncbi:ABC transporter ATP-binding protein [Conexibacter sp. CPCC 206217]|uniref:ABC transporter ATP-binding protein n=1 Tax=Conexibacter sp. CPCC 206217 TaxID=3064574 RepID=UPI0027194B54|nr:ABC transporter ATP-binding protein [Conexibacter sp. CPCC 206217]MDO8210342.1 ABC transporter ATP-binding protein [Conexibacter sp. CPCC 206217]
MTMTDHVLSVRDLTLTFPQQYGETQLLRDVSLDLVPGETVGIVGESGSGKTLLGLTMLGLEPKTAYVGGQVLFGGRDMHAMSNAQKRALRGSGIAMIYQDALVSLNPSMKVKAQLKQALGDDAERSAEELLRAVQLDETDRFLEAFPHQLSGGQRQRVLIAMAIARKPRVVIADEPTTALDVTVQAGIMRLLRRLRDELQFALVLVSHDLGLVAGVADRVAVMYAGDLVELGPTQDVLARSAHPYTAGLIEASRSLEEGRARLAQIVGVVPAPADFATACRFQDRCPRAAEQCRVARPPAVAPIGGGRTVLCHFPLVETAPGAVGVEPVAGSSR